VREFVKESVCVRASEIECELVIERGCMCFRECVKESDPERGEESERDDKEKRVRERERGLVKE